MSPPSDLVVTWRARLEAAAKHGPVVDLACGRGRHVLALARWGIPVLGVDRNPAHLRECREAALREGLPVTLVRADLEAGPALPLRPGCAGAVLVFRYLHRPLATALAETLRPGGLLLYETFTIHQRDLGHGPRRAEFLLDPGELRSLFPALRTLHSWEGIVESPRAEAVAQLAAERP